MYVCVCRGGGREGKGGEEVEEVERKSGERVES